MDYVDYYKILGVSKTASQDDIKGAYRKLARKLHPDLNPDDKTANKKFQEINEANEVLGDPENRKKYDQYGKDWKHSAEFEKARQQRQSQPSGGYSGFNDDFEGGGDFSDFFSSMFGGGGGRNQTKYRGQDYNAEMNINLSEIFTTRQETITVNGKNIRVSIPAGIENGQKLKLKALGTPGRNGGPNGDLIITFNVINNTNFKRDGADLFSTVEVNLYTAILGGEVTVSTIGGGKVKLKVNPETQNNTKIRLKGKGIPHYKKETFGDLYITYSVLIPTNLTEKQKALFDELSKL